MCREEVVDGQEEETRSEEGSSTSPVLGSMTWPQSREETTAEGMEQRWNGQVHEVDFAGVHVVCQGRRKTYPTTDAEGQVSTSVLVQEDW
jgi:hypothetical protein